MEAADKVVGTIGANWRQDSGGCKASGVGGRHCYIKKKVCSTRKSVGAARCCSPLEKVIARLRRAPIRLGLRYYSYIV